MLFQLLGGALDQDSIIILLMSIPIILISLSLHELSHGYVALLCGDPTARNFGRLTMNPTKHLDPIGALMMFLVGFGWAKPVPVNPRNFKNSKRDTALVGLAGPVSNILLAFVCTFLLFLVCRMNGLKIIEEAIYYTSISAKNETSKITLVLIQFLSMAITLNLGLAVFNLIPIPPLDGSRIVSAVIPNKYYHSYTNIEQHSRIIFLVLIFSSYIPFPFGSFNYLSDLLFFPVDWLRDALYTVFFSLFEFIFF